MSARSCPANSRDNSEAMRVSGPSFFLRKGEIKGGHPCGTYTTPHIATPSLSSVAPLGSIASKLNEWEPIVRRDFVLSPQSAPLETSEPADGGKSLSRHTPDRPALPGFKLAPGAHEMSRISGWLHSGCPTPPAHSGAFSLTTSASTVSPAHAAPSSFPYDNFLSPTRNGSNWENYWEPIATSDSFQQLLQPENVILDGFESTSNAHLKKLRSTIASSHVAFATGDATGNNKETLMYK
ncbi:hypothetical protein COCON_G00066700 [Conger conger]|uniref:Uncharacterized protein n=1 Tax=Conger conger TaxID=82655 RepID=A0A9Q1I3A4_CONCO|nr:hypothetical protein COCON_G00066700 [Conger conger]